jgi:hypothetical protein
MSNTEPVAERPFVSDRETVTVWAEGRARLAEARTYWLSSLLPDGRPHVRPHFAVLLDNTLYFTSSPASRKGENLARDPRCSISTGTTELDLVVEGTAEQVTDDATLGRVSDAYKAKYGWPTTVRDGAFDAPYGAPTAGPPPYAVYAVRPGMVFGFPTGDGEFSPTRWRFL